MAFNESIIKIWNTYLGKQRTESSIVLDSFFTFISLIHSMTKMDAIRNSFFKMKEKGIEKTNLPHSFSSYLFNFMVFISHVK